jgi:hypothetical protein
MRTIKFITILGIIIYSVSAQTAGSDNDSLQQDSAVVVEGILIDNENGGAPDDDSLYIMLDTVKGTANQSGEFTFITPGKQFFSISVFSGKYKPVHKTITCEAGRKNYFLTLTLEKTDVSKETAQNNKVDTAYVPWTISGTIIDSRFDLAIESDSTVMLFDKDTISVSENGNFHVKTNISGPHSFYVSIPGYHKVSQSITLDEKDKQPYIVIPTTILSKTVSRREITVSADALPVHRSSSVAKVSLSREELKRTSATLNDPFRVLQTLPGVASESDASSRPIVRGGDVLESRVFLDGLTLIQPFHFGGARSNFNQQSIKTLTLYKSGFPPEFHNAQSAIIEAESRIPSDEKTSFDFDLNFLQYSAYLGFPLLKGKVGLNFSSQGSYTDAVSKLALKIASISNKDLKNTIKLINLPDYQDFTAGISIAPNPKLKIFINNILNTDRVKFCTGDTVTDVSHKYYRVDENGVRYLEDSYITQGYYWNEGFNVYPYYRGDTQYVKIDSVLGKPYYKVDTMLDYSSRYNILYGTARFIPDNNNIVNLTLGWQKRWWDLNFPDGSYFDRSVYDVNIDQYNANLGWLYSGINNHILKTGLQLDYTVTDYDVYLVRYLHEIIENGSTNFVDFWGPVNGDSSTTISTDNDAMNMMDRILVAYKGNKRFYNVGYYLSDSWDLSPKLHCDIGARLEYSNSDHIASISPRLSLRYNLSQKHELIGSLGHYTQNNYSISAIALSENLKPEKVWHCGLGTESKFLPWLTQKIDLYGKYYYDLISEIISSMLSYEGALYFIEGTYDQNYLDTLSPEQLQKLINEVIYNYSTYRSHYINEGRGYSFGFEYMLRFEPADFWGGWISFSWGHSVRERKPGWRMHPFPLDRPLLISINNYYRLPRKYEISLKYRYMSGIPYTSVTTDSNIVRIGAFNDRRYAPYQRLDIRFSKGFAIKGAKGHFYTEIWNAMNAPNIFCLDSKTKIMQTMNSNLPATMLYIGVDCSY